MAINGHEFLLDERDGKGLGDGSAAAVKQLFRVNLAGATDVSQISGSANLAPLAVAKTPFLDIVAALVAGGVSTIHIPAKIEGISFGPDVTLNGVVKHTLFIANDNDFTAATPDKNKVVTDNPNQFFVFAFGDADLPGFVAQRFSTRHDDDHRHDD